MFVKPEENEQLKDLHSKVKKRFSFKNYPFNPHVTVGYRDLTFENYLKAWEIYKEKHFKTKFIVDKITLLRHDGKWIPIAEKKLENIKKPT